MFKQNVTDGQKSLFDPYVKYPDYMLELLHKSWAEDFRNNIFIHINEERFACLYSDITSRPNKPVNVLIGLFILKELFHLVDEDLMRGLYFDYQFQYALGITDFEKERLCINTITNFRSRLLAYEVNNGVDLLKIEVDALSNRLAELIELNKNMARMDSLMVSSSCKKLTRLELVYTVNQKMVHAMKKLNPAIIPKGLDRYLNQGDKNSFLYHTRNEQAESKLDGLLRETQSLYEATFHWEECRQTAEFRNLSRLINEQCVQTEEGDCIPIEGKQIIPNSLQNPSDPDATHRKKGKKEHTGYVLNVAEVRDQQKKVGLILSHDYQPNQYADANFGEDFVAKDPLAEEIGVLAIDGAYYRSETMETAQGNGIELNFSQMTGRKANDKIGVDRFEIDLETQQITKCLADKVPLKTEYDPEKDVYQAWFSKPDCAICPFKEQCIVKEQKKSYSVRFTGNKLKADLVRSVMGTERHQELSNFRAGVEGIPSVMRRTYDIDRMPVRGYLRSKLWVNLKIMAYNTKSFMNYRKRIAKYGLGLSFFAHLSLEFIKFINIIHNILNYFTTLYPKTFVFGE